MELFLVSYNVFVFCWGSKASQVPACLIFTYISLARPGSPEKMSILGGHAYTHSQTRSPRSDLPGNHSPFQRAWSEYLGVQSLLGHSCLWELSNPQPLSGVRSFCTMKCVTFWQYSEHTESQILGSKSCSLTEDWSIFGRQVGPRSRAGSAWGGSGTSCARKMDVLKDFLSNWNIKKHKEQYMWPILIIKKGK